MRLFKFRLRTLCIALGLIGVAVGYFAVRVSKQKFVVSRITAAGGAVGYESSFFPESWFSTIPVESLGADNLCHVSSVHFAGLALGVVDLPTVTLDGDTTVVECRSSGKVHIGQADPSRFANLKAESRGDTSYAAWQDKSMVTDDVLLIELMMPMDYAQPGVGRVVVRVRKSK